MEAEERRENIAKEANFLAPQYDKACNFDKQCNKKLTADEQNSILGFKFFAVLYLDSKTTGVRINNGDEAIADVSDDEDDKGEGQNMVE